MPDTPEKCITNLLSDSPTREDAFGHASVADAIAELVTTEAGAKCIGLTGTWGSGKSSVVEILREKLAKLGAGTFDTFLFDAWAHQGDPLRRSFLEKLIDRLIAITWLQHAGDWKEKKEELAKRVQTTTTTSEPQLTFLGGAFAVTLLLLPLGYELFVRYIPEPRPQVFLGILGLFVILLPFLLISGTWLFWRPSLRIWEGAFWVTHRRPYHQRSLLALFLNKSQETTRSNTVRAPDPTSVEFQKIFGELIDEALRPSNRRLLIIVDNLDRVGASDALAIWATLKTFFDFDAHTHSTCLERLWLLLPFDETAIRKLWSDSSRKQDADPTTDNGKDLGQSFVDKTFQITFRVSPPVLSDWHEFLIRQLKAAFPTHSLEDFHDVYRIYDLRAIVPSKPPTPRDIKIFVNRIGAIHRQWGDRISLPVQALYVVLSKIDDNLAEGLAFEKDEHILKRVPADMVGTDWREGLAAIHFSVPKERALQVLMGAQLKDCLASADEGKIKQLAAIPGFTGVLERQIEENCPEWDKGETNRIAISASIIAKVPEANDPSWNRTWTLLCQFAQHVKVWSKFDAQVADGIIQIFKHSPTVTLLKNVIVATSNSVPREPVPQDVIDGWLDGVVALIAAFREEHAAVIERNLALATGPAIYVQIIVSAANKHLPEYICYLRPAVSDQLTHIMAEFSKLVADGKFDDAHLNAVLAMRGVRAAWPWDSLTEAMSSRLRTPSNLPIPEVSALLSALLSFEETVQAAKGSLASLCTAGYMSIHLNFASSDSNTAALCVLPILETIPAGNQSTVNTHSQSGINIYKQLLAKPDDKNDLVAALAKLVIKHKKLELLYTTPTKEGSTTALIQAILRQIALGDEACEHIPPARLIANKDYLKVALGNDLFESHVSRSVTGASLTAELSGRAFELGDVDLYKTALSVNEQNSGFAQFLISGMQSVTKETWITNLVSEGELLDLLVEIQDSGRCTDLGVEFEDALLNHAQQLVDGTARVERLRERWNLVFEGLEKNFRSVTLKKMVEILCTSSKPTAALLRLYGSLMASPEVLSSISERVVMHAFPQFLERLHVEELQWCSTVLERNPNCLIEVGPSTRQDLKSRIVAAASEQTIGEEVRHAIHKLAGLADVDLSTSEAASKAPDSSQTESNPNA
jgi:hypothetical protein